MHPIAQWFKLVSSVKHIGQVSAGHYTTEVKIQDEIFQFDDESVGFTKVPHTSEFSKFASYLMYQETDLDPTTTTTTIISRACKRLPSNMAH